VIYRQGDVWLYRLTEKEFSDRTRIAIPRDRKQGIVLAEGEVTGHHHKIRKGGRLYQDGRQNSVRLLSASGPVSLTHEEHETIELPAGKYEVRIQREYEPQAVSRQSYVRD